MLKKLKSNILGFSGLAVILSLAIVVGVILSVYSLRSTKNYTGSNTSSTGSTTTSSSSSSSANVYKTLSPANVPSKTAECQQQVTYSSDGNSGPIQCSNGDLNTTEWSALAALEPKVMSLGYSASAATVQATLCSDVRANISNSIELTSYKISSLYYGWSFSSDASVDITNGTCVNTDD